MNRLFGTPLRRDPLAWTAGIWGAIILIFNAWLFEIGAITASLLRQSLMASAVSWAVTTGLLAGVGVLHRRRRPPRAMTTGEIVTATLARVVVPLIVFALVAFGMMAGACSSGCL